MKGLIPTVQRLCAFSLALCMIALGTPQRVRAADAPLSKVSIQLGSIPGANWAPLYMAKDLGLYAKEGLDVDVLPGKTSQDAINAVVTGSVTMAVILVLNQIISYDKGLKTVAVGSFLGRNSFGLIVANDIGVKSLRELGGKKILVVSAVNEALMRGVIKHAGGNPDTSTYVLTPNPSALIGTFVGKQADAIETVIPFGALGVGTARPFKIYPFNDEGSPEPSYVIVVKPETLQTQKATIAKTLRAIYAAYQIAITDNDKLTASAVKTIPGATAASVLTDWSAFGKFFCDPAQKNKSFAAFIPRNWETATKFYLSIGAIDHPIDPKALYTNEFAEGPNAVTKMKCPV